MRDSDKLLVLAVFITALFLFASLFRWDVQATDGYRSWKFDRLTGTLWNCNPIRCSEVSHVSE